MKKKKHKNREEEKKPLKNNSVSFFVAALLTIKYRFQRIILFGQNKSHFFPVYVTTPFSIISGISSQGPKPSAIACAIPNRGAFLLHKGLKWSVMQILPPRYILAVFPSNSGNAISGAVMGYVTGTSNSTSNSYFLRSWMCQHFPNHLVPSLLDSNL